MKILYQYNVPFKTFVKEEVKTDEGTLIKDVEKTVDKVIGIKSPSRTEKDDGDMVYSLRLSECIKLGMLTKAQLTKQFSELGGLWSEKENQEYIDLVDEYQKVQNTYTEADIKYRAEPNDANKTLLAIQYTKLMDIYTRIRQFEDHKSEIFNETAEVKARNRALLWYVCYLTYTLEKDEQWLPLVKGKTFEEKLDNYDAILDEGEEWQQAALDKATLIVSLWYSGKINSQEDIKLIEEMLQSSDEDEPEAETEEVVVEATAEPVVEAKPTRKKKAE